MKFDLKSIGRYLVYGVGITLLTPVISPGLIPAIMSFGFLGLTVGNVLGAGIAAFGVGLLNDKVLKL